MSSGQDEAFCGPSGSTGISCEALVWALAVSKKELKY